MNILILSWRGPGHLHEGGAEQVTHEHAKGWVKAGHDVTLFTSYYKGAKRKEYIDEVEVIRHGGEILGVQIAAFFWYLIKGRKRFDLVIDQFHGMPFFTPLYVRTRKMAFIHEVAKDVWKLNPLPKPYNIIPSYVGSFLEPYIFKIYKKIPFMTVSDSTKEDLIRWGIPKNNITVVHSGVKVKKIAGKAKKDNKKTALFLGALSKDKGIEDAIKVFAEIERRDTNWQYWVVGKGSKEYIEDLKKIVGQQNLESKVKFWGFVSERTKFNLLARSTLLINTSVREGWGLVNIEANSTGTPVVGYDVPGVRDSVQNGKTGLLSKYGDFRDVARNAVKLVSNNKQYKQYQERCIKWSKKFTWKDSIEQSLELIESI